MAHFVKIDENNVVVNVVVVRNEDCQDSSGNELEEIGLAYLANLDPNIRWVKTSYGSIGNVHYNHSPEGNSPSGKPAFRKNYAGIGFTYDPFRDAFIPPKPEDPNNPDRYVLNEKTCLWDDNLEKSVNIGVKRI